MHYQLVTIALALASGSLASPIISPQSNYIELYREKATVVEEGHLVYFGPSATGAPMTHNETAALRARKTCPNNQTPSCDTHHTARNDICEALVTELAGDGSVLVGHSPRQICYLGTAESDAYCCVSWHNVIPGLTKGDLADDAYNILSTCTTSGISGKLGNILVNGICTNVCLSNRGTHC